MNRAKFFRGVNIFLSLVLLIALVTIVWLLWESNQTNNVINKDQINKNITSEEKIVDDSKLIVVDDKNINDLDSDEKSKDEDDSKSEVRKDVEKEEVNDEKNESDQEVEVSDKDTSTKVYHGILMKADDDNEYGGNYMLKNDGDTLYTYFWFDSGYAENGVDNMVGQEVEIEVLIQDDGSFVVTDGPKIV